MTLLSRLLAARLGLPPAVTGDVTVHRDARVRAPDGTVLLTDAYVAAPGRPLPVILLRTPYGRRRNCSPAPAARTPTSSPACATWTRRASR